MNDAPKLPSTNQANRPRRSSRPTGVDLRAVYDVLLKAYLRNHPEALTVNESIEEANYD
jgi:hypothetical protein